MDYLHQSPPIVPWIPSYPARDPQATPYNLLISTPQPSTEAGQVALYAVSVDAPLPRPALPLAEDEAVVFDLQAAYVETLRTVPGFQFLIDLTQPPVDFDSYTPEDQARIRAIYQS